MSVILYGKGGQSDQDGGVFLNVTHVNFYKREAVYAGSDYLYTKHTLSVRALFNPGTQTDVLVGKPLTWLQAAPHTLPAIPTTRDLVGPLRSSKVAPHQRPLAGTLPAVFTAESVKHYLMTPRLRLQWAWDNQNVLVSPLPGLSVDEFNGPTPISCDVIEFHSGKTWLVDWVVSTAVNECPVFSANPWPILSSQWGQRHDIDEHFLTTVTTRGTVIFSPSVLLTSGVAGPGTTFRPDDLRRLWLAVPLPSNMKRGPISTQASPDGLQVEWEVVDRELPVMWEEDGVTKVVGVHTVTNELPNLAVPASTPLIGGISLIDLAVRSATARDALGDVFFDRNSRVGRFGRLALNKAFNVATGMLDTNFAGLLCTSVHTVQLQVWGTRGTLRNALEDFARDVIRTRIIPAKTGGLPLITLKSQVSHSIEGNFVVCEEVFRGGPLRGQGGAAFGFGTSLPTRTPGGQRVFGNDNDTGELLADDVDFEPQGPPNSAGTRGTFTEILVTSALSRSCDPSANVPPPASREEKYDELWGSRTAQPWPKPAWVS